jgi:putative ATP-binding cassette transporter
MSRERATEHAKSQKKSSPPEDSGKAGESPESEQFSETEKSQDFEDEMKTLEESGEDTEELRRQYLLRRFWQTASGFWGRRGRRIAWVLSAALMVIILLNIASSYAMNLWNRAIFDALQNKDANAVLFLSMIYFAILLASVSVNVTQVYARMTIQRRWRQWLTDNLVDRWLTNGRYYQLNLVSGEHQNPEYRIADDVRIAVESPVDFVTGVVTAFLSAVTFIVVLWTIGGALDFTAGGFHVYIPGFLVIAAVIYAAVASGAMVLIGRRFVTVSEQKNQSEAELRYVLTRLRENGESIALIRGEEEERAGVDRSLKKVLLTWRDICFQSMKTTIVSQTSSYIAPVLPIILCAPKYLDGTMSLGEVMQAASAFTIVQGAFNWLVDNYPRLADWTASARRAASLMVSLDAL